MGFFDRLKKRKKKQDTEKEKEIKKVPAPPKQPKKRSSSTTVYVENNIHIDNYSIADDIALMTATSIIADSSYYGCDCGCDCSYDSGISDYCDCGCDCDW